MSLKPRPARMPGPEGVDESYDGTMTAPALAYCRPVLRAATSVDGLAAWKFRVFTFQPTAAAAALRPLPSSPHSSCSHCRNRTVFPVGGLAVSASVTGMVVGKVPPALAAAAAAAASPDGDAGAEAAAVAPLALVVEPGLDELHAAAADISASPTALHMSFLMT